MDEFQDLDLATVENPFLTSWGFEHPFEVTCDRVLARFVCDSNLSIYDGFFAACDYVFAVFMRKESDAGGDESPNKGFQIVRKFEWFFWKPSSQTGEVVPSALRDISGLQTLRGI